MDYWEEVKLGDLVKTNVKTINSKYTFEEIEYLDTGSITMGKISSLQRFNIKEAPSRAKRLVEQDDIIYSTVRPVQRHFGYINNPLKNLVVSTGFATITCNKNKLEPKFLYQYLGSDDIVEYLEIIAEASTSAYPSLRPKDIENLIIPLPPLPEQKAIASVLSSFDDKIDLLHRQNQTLEAMAEALFKEWFVVNAREEWEKGTVLDFFKLQRGYDLPTQKRAEGKYPILASSGLSGTHLEYKVKGPGVVTGRSGVIGNVFFIDEDFWPLNTSLFILEYRLATPLFAYQLLKTLDLPTLNGGSAVPTLNRNDVHQIEVLLPIKREIDKFEKTVKPFFKKIKTNQKQIDTLNKLRETLLPKLMSGELRVKI